MLLPKLFLLTLSFSKLITHMDAKCLKGHRVTLDGGCAICYDGYYQPEENESQECKPCTKCNQEHGSFAKHACTRETNTQCQCRTGFVQRERDFATCKCDIGFGLQGQECVKCKDGHFTTKINSVCQKWKECKSGVNKTGTKTSDVICNDLGDNVKNIIIQLTSLRPNKETQTQPARIKTTTTASPKRTYNPVETTDSPPSLNSANYIGVALLLFVIVGLLILTAVTCKLHISPCMQRKTAVPPRDSCRRPVEESGDGSLSSLKLCQEEP